MLPSDKRLTHDFTCWALNGKPYLSIVRFLSLPHLKCRVIFYFQAPLLISAGLTLEDTIFAEVILYFLVLIKLFQGCFHLLNMSNSTHCCTYWQWCPSRRPAFLVEPASVLWRKRETRLHMSGDALVCLHGKVIYISLSGSTSEDVRRQVTSVCRNCSPFYYQRRRRNKITEMIQPRSGHRYRYLLKVNNKSVLSEWLSFSQGRMYLVQTCIYMRVCLLWAALMWLSWEVPL